MVSIRSPYRSKGRYTFSVRAVNVIGFQSAPLTEARGDRPAIKSLSSMLDVSIRSPYRSKGRCHESEKASHLLNSFNPLPLPKQGEMTMTGSGLDGFLLFQSAPLTEARGDPAVLPTPLFGSKFQSAPLTEARGDIGFDCIKAF